MLEKKRRLLRNIGSLALAATSGHQLRAAPLSHAPEVPGKAGTTLFGSAVKPDLLGVDPAYNALLRHWCEVMVAEGGMKWDAIHPDPEGFNFLPADTFLGFAADNKMLARGHTLIWHQSMPQWTRFLSTAADARRALISHIDTVVKYCSTRVQSWDVVNEPLPDRTSGVGERRNSLWQSLLGDDYIALAFRTAARNAPDAELVLNEYDLEFRGAPFDHKRAAMLALLGQLRHDEVPVHALGLEGHLRSDHELDRSALKSFLKEVRDLGLATLVTEMDVMDHALSADPATRDREAAWRVDEFLDTVFSVQPPTKVLTWGLTDRLVWVPGHFKRKDGLANRPLPLDELNRPKEMMKVIDRYRGAGGRT